MSWTYKSTSPIYIWACIISLDTAESFVFKILCVILSKHCCLSNNLHFSCLAQQCMKSFTVVLITTRRGKLVHFSSWIRWPAAPPRLCMLFLPSFLLTMSPLSNQSGGGPWQRWPGWGEGAWGQGWRRLPGSCGSSLLRHSAAAATSGWCQNRRRPPPL